MVYTYCYFNSNLIKIYVKESVTDIMKHPVCVFPSTFNVLVYLDAMVTKGQYLCLRLHHLQKEGGYLGKEDGKVLGYVTYVTGRIDVL